MAPSADVPSSPSLPRRGSARHRASAPRRFRDPATVAGLALIAAAGSTGVLTFGFWWLLARRDGAAAVGAVSAEVSAATFLASVGSLNMLNVLARFLPEAGRSARRLIRHGYLALVVTSAAVAGLFLLTPWADRLVLGGGAGRVGFVALVVATGVFLVQDGALVGLGHTLLVPLENVLTALTRLALIVVLPLAAAGGSLLAWGTATVASVLVVNAFTLTRHEARGGNEEGSLPRTGELVRFIALEGVANAISAAVLMFVPAVVAVTMGAEAAGFFYVPWLALSIVVTFLSAVQLSMVREVVARPAERAGVVRRSLALSAGVVLVGVVGCLAVGPLLLHLLGPGFAEHAGMLLVWFGLALPATAVVVVFWSVCLIARRPVPGLVVNTLTAAVMIVGIQLLAGGPLSRVGLLYLVVEWAVAAAVVVPTWRGLLGPSQHQRGQS
jgi:O-antigen/teichoic acid export membrane protein